MIHTRKFSKSYDILWPLTEPLGNVGLCLDAVVEEGEVRVAAEGCVVTSYHMRDEVIDSQVRIRHL